MFFCGNRFGDGWYCERDAGHHGDHGIPRYGLTEKRWRVRWWNKLLFRFDEWRKGRLA